MMVYHPMNFTRRDRLSRCTALAALPEVLSALQHAHTVKGSSRANFETLDPATAGEIEAIAAQIIPFVDVTGAIYFDKQRREVFQRAKAIFVCANGAETPKLLLISKSKRFPDGLANSSGLAGKYLMWDNGAEVQGLFEHPLNEHKGIQVTRLIHDHYAADPARGFYGGGAIDARFDFLPANFALH